MYLVIRMHCLQGSFCVKFYLKINFLNVRATSQFLFITLANLLKLKGFIHLLSLSNLQLKVKVWLAFDTLALHPLVAQTIQNGAALVADGGAWLVVMLQPGVWRAGLGLKWSIKKCQIVTSQSSKTYNPTCSFINILCASLAGVW